MQYFVPITLLGEFLGTLLIILIGNGVVYSTSHVKMFANQSGKWVLISLAWGLGVFTGAIVAQAFESGAQLNPAVSIYQSIHMLDATQLIYIPMQFLGAIFGQLILNFINYKHIIETANSDVYATRSAHCTNPAFDNKKDKVAIYNFSYELVGTFVLLLAIYAIELLPFHSSSNSTEEIITGSFGPIPVSLVIMAIGMSLGSSTGYAINPARDLGPRIVYAVQRNYFSKKSQSTLIDANWSYSWVPVVAPIIASCIMGGLSRIGM